MTPREMVLLLPADTEVPCQMVGPLDIEGTRVGTCVDTVVPELFVRRICVDPVGYRDIIILAEVLLVGFSVVLVCSVIFGVVVDCVAVSVVMVVSAA